MSKTMLCEECNIEFRVKHDAGNPELYPTKYCPFCGSCIAEDTWYEREDDIDPEDHEPEL